MAYSNRESAIDVMSALKRVLASEQFRRSARLSTFLRHLVETTLAGEKDRLGGYALGVDVFERKEDFNPDVDSIVRVHAVRLRAALARYYLTEGTSDPLMIKIPKGGYVPKFYQSDKTSPAGKTDTALVAMWKKLPSRWWNFPPAFNLLIAICAISILSYIIFYPALNPLGGEKNKLTEPVKLLTRPSILVMRFRDITDKKNVSFAEGITTQITSDLARFKDLFVFAPDTALGVGSLQTAWDKYNVDYALMGTVQNDNDKGHLTVQLVELPRGLLAWSQKFEINLNSKNLINTQSKISKTIVAAIGQPYGVINRLESLTNRRSTEKTITGYNCYLQFFEYTQQENRKMHQEVRDCLEKTVSESPDFAAGWAALSRMLVDEKQRGFNPRPRMEPALKRALQAARNSVIIAPNSAFTHRQLANVYMSIGETSLAKSEIMLALKLNPYNAEVLADVGWILYRVGNWDAALAYANKAIALNPAHPQWYLKAPFLYHYRNNECEEASDLASKYYQMNSNTLLSHIFVIALSARCGNKAGVSSHFKYIQMKFPNFLKKPRQSLLNQAVSKPLIQLIITDLKKAGMKVPMT